MWIEEMIWNEVNIQKPIDCFLTIWRWRCCALFTTGFAYDCLLQHYDDLSIVSFSTILFFSPILYVAVPKLKSSAAEDLRFLMRKRMYRLPFVRRMCVCVCASVALQWIEYNQQKSSLTLWHIKISVLWSQVPGLNFFSIISFFWWWSKTILISEMYISVKAEKSTSGHFCMCSGPDNDSSVGKRFDWTNRVHICNIATFSGEG